MCQLMRSEGNSNGDGEGAVVDEKDQTGGADPFMLVHGVAVDGPGAAGYMQVGE
jgi:hypothetical protein